MTVSAFGCSYVVFAPCSRMSSSCDFTAEWSMPFCDKDGGQFWFSCRKKACKSHFRLWHEINNIKNSRQSSIKLSSLFLAYDWLGLAFSLKGGSKYFVTGSFNQEGVWVSAMSFTNFSHCFWLMGATCFMISLIKLSATSIFCIKYVQVSWLLFEGIHLTARNPNISRFPPQPTIINTASSQEQSYTGMPS